MGPLQGIRIIELAGLGPAPFCAMMLADMGATVIRVDRVSAQPGEARSGRHPAAQPSVDRAQPEESCGNGGVAAAHRRCGCLDRRLPARRRRASRRGAGGLSRAQSEARLRAHDGLGPVRTPRAFGGARHQLPRAHRRAAPDRRGRPQAGSATESRRRFWRRRHDAARRAAGGPAGSLPLRQGSGHRCRHDRRRHRVAQHLLRHARGRSRTFATRPGS